MPAHALAARQAEREDIAFTLAQPAAWMVLLGAASFAGLAFATNAGLPIQVAAALAMGVGDSVACLQRRDKRRMELIAEQLPDRIDLMVRSLRVGPPFSPAPLRPSPPRSPPPRFEDGHDHRRGRLKRAMWSRRRKPWPPARHAVPAVPSA